MQKLKNLEKQQAQPSSPSPRNVAAEKQETEEIVTTITPAQKQEASELEAEVQKIQGLTFEQIQEMIEKEVAKSEEKIRGEYETKFKLEESKRKSLERKLERNKKKRIKLEGELTQIKSKLENKELESNLKVKYEAESKKLQRQIDDLEKDNKKVNAELAVLKETLSPVAEKHSQEQTLIDNQKYLLNHNNANVKNFFLTLRKDMHSMFVSSLASDRLRVQDNSAKTAISATASFASTGVKVLKAAGEVSGAAVPLAGAAISATALAANTANKEYQESKQRQMRKTLLEVANLEAAADEVARMLTFRYEEQISNLQITQGKAYDKCEEASELATSIVNKIDNALQDGKIAHKACDGSAIPGQLAAVVSEFSASQGIANLREKRLEQSSGSTVTDEGLMRRGGIKWLSADSKTAYYSVASDQKEQERVEKYGYRWAFGNEIKTFSGKRKLRELAYFLLL